MSRITKAVIIAACLIAFAGGSYAASDWLTGNTEEKLETLAKIQPGLGTVMIEYANRYTNIYYAAKGGNWGLAGYQLKEALEIQEVGEATRPGRASSLKAFESAYLDKLGETILAEDFAAFEKAFNAGIQGCNGCHAGQGFPYIKYELPAAPPASLSMKP